MRATAAFNAAMTGTRVGDRLQVSVWRRERCLIPDLPLASWKLSWDADRQIPGTLSLVVADSEGTHAPWSLTDPLGPGGSKLMITYISGASGLRCPIGRWRITKSRPSNGWRLARVGETWRWLPKGGTVQVEASEDFVSVKLSSLLDAGAQSSNAYAELYRLLEGLMPIRPVSGWEVLTDTDPVLPLDYTHPTDRMDAVEDLVDQLGARYRMGPVGECELIQDESVRGLTPVMEINPGQGGTLIEWNRWLDADHVFNAVRATGRERETYQNDQKTSQYEISAMVFDSVSETGWDSAFGPAPVLVSTTLYGEPEIQERAKQELAAILGRSIDLDVRMMSQPGLQLWDPVRINVPLHDGQLESIDGRLVGMEMASAGGVAPVSMDARVRVPHQSMEQLAGRVNRVR